MPSASAERAAVGAGAAAAEGGGASMPPPEPGAAARTPRRVQPPASGGGAVGRATASAGRPKGGAPAALAVTCYICGEPVDVAGIARHTKQCAAKFWSEAAPMLPAALKLQPPLPPDVPMPIIALLHAHTDGGAAALARYSEAAAARARAPHCRCVCGRVSVTRRNVLAHFSVCGMTAKYLNAPTTPRNAPPTSATPAADTPSTATKRRAAPLLAAAPATAAAAADGAAVAGSAAKTTAAALGTVRGGRGMYEITAMLGSGKFSVVYKARRAEDDLYGLSPFSARRACALAFARRVSAWASKRSSDHSGTSSLGGCAGGWP